MLKQWFKRITMTFTAVVIVALFAWLIWPQPIPVDVAKVVRGPMETTIEEEGVNRIRDVYVVSAPTTGKLLRPEIETGDHVTANQTLVATIAPADPIMLDVRTQREFTAAVEGAKDAREVAELQVAKAEREHSYAHSEFQKAKQLAGKKVISLSQLDQRTLEMDISEKALLAAKAQLKMRNHDLEIALARLEGGTANGKDTSSCCVKIRTPVTGTILSKLAESERVIQAGMPIMEIGDPRRSEIAVDLLSTDAVNVKPGTTARIMGWGGENALQAIVTRIEPSAFTKISALGIEEQRVKALLELKENEARLGHQFRVIAEIIMWKSDDALQIPISALVRKGDSWAAYRVADNHAELMDITVGHMNGHTAEVLSGLSVDETVIVHPSDLVEDGVNVVPRDLVPELP